MMLNACVYIDIWSNASSIYLLWQMQNQQKAHIQRNGKKSNNLRCWITSDHDLHMKEEKRLFMQKHTRTDLCRGKL